MDIKNEMVKRLRQDCQTLLVTKIPRALENISDERGINTYRNLTKALADNIKLIEEYDYQLMYSEYTDVTDENKPVKQIAVWEQNGDCDIRNHKVWNVKDAINSSGVVADTIKGVCNVGFEKCDDNKYKKFEESIKSMILKFSENKKLIIPTSEMTRNIGKTTFLIKQAIENNGIYIGKNKRDVDDARKFANETLGSILQTVYFRQDEISIKKAIFDEPIYIDEGVDLARVDLDKNKCVAFKYVPLNSI